MNSTPTESLHSTTNKPVEVGSSGVELARRAVDAEGFRIVCLGVLATLLSFWGLRSGPGLSDHEAIVAVGARSILQSGNWLIPTVGEEEFLRKPPLAFWLAAVTSKLVDHCDHEGRVSEFAARAPSAAAAVLCVLTVYFLGCAMFGQRCGAVCAVVMASSAGTLFFAHNAQVEMVLTLLSTCAVACFWFATESCPPRRIWWPCFYFFLALAMLAKAPIPLATVVLPLGAWWLITKPLAFAAECYNQAVDSRAPSLQNAFRVQLRRVSRFWLLPGIILFMIFFLPWPLFVYFSKPGVTDLWRLEFLDRYTGELTPSDHSVLYYIPIALGLALPYSLSLPAAFASGSLKSFLPQRNGLLFAFTCVAVQLVFFSTSAFKRPHYLLGAWPGMALLLGPVLERFFFHDRFIPVSRRVLGAVALAVVLGAGFIFGGKELSRKLPAALPLFQSVMVLLGIGVIACFTMYALGRRATSFALLFATTAVTFAWTWDSLGQREVLDCRLSNMMQQLERTTIGPSDRITWVMGRPDARLMYYQNLDVQPLFSALELAPKRSGRHTVEAQLLDEGIAEVRKRLLSDQREYFVIKGQYWDMLQSEMAASAQLVFRVPFDSSRPKDDWVVITNPWNTE